MSKVTVWPEITLDRSPQAPTLRRQIERQLASAIRDGKLPHGSRLPSSRLLARMLSVSRGTVVEAFDALLASGTLIATAGSGIHIAHPSPTVPNFSNLKRTAAAAHYPARTIRFEDCDGTGVYLNVR
jgi:GntR family transcriptional regulator/MocR family aminotransferase